MSFWDRFSGDRLVAAHRGYRAIRAENTLSAFEASIGRCDFIELDVGFSKDGVPIIIHDDTLQRTSDAESLALFSPPYNVVDYPYEMLKQLDVSSWFLASDPFGTLVQSKGLREEIAQLPPQRIPTLDTVLSLLKQHNLPVNIEIKDMRNTRFDTTAVQKTLEVIRNHTMEEMVLLSSFNHRYVAEAKVLAPEIERAALQEDAHADHLVSYLQSLGVHCYHSDKEIITEPLVQTLLAAGITVNVFTVNDPAEQEKLFGYGVRSVFTDFLL